MSKQLFLIISICGMYVGTMYAQPPADKPVPDVILKNTSDKDVPFPYIGKCVVAVFYTDPDCKDVNDPLSDAITAKKYPTDAYRGVGIGNCADTWLPNVAIRLAGQKKEKQYPTSTILLDTNNELAKAWNLGACNEFGVVIVIGKDRKVKFFMKVKSQNESRGIISAVLKTIEKEISK